MEIDKALREVHDNTAEILRIMLPPAREKVNHKTSYVCPICGHGIHGDGLTFNPKSKNKYGLKCFSCGFSGDVVDLVIAAQGKDFVKALEEAAGHIGITIDKKQKEQHDPKYYHREEGSGLKNTEQPEPAPPKERKEGETVREEKTDYTAFFLQAKANNNGEYLKSRGISKEIQDRFEVGYAELWKHPNVSDKVPKTPRVIFPTSESTYTARYAGDPDNDPNYNPKYKKVKVGHGAPPYCSKAAFEANEPIFVVEGETDALSIWELDFVAVSIGSTVNAGAFVEVAKKHKDKQYIIALDNDKAGKTAIEVLEKGFKENGISYITADINGNYNDPNDRLQEDESGLMQALKLAILQISNPEEYKRELLSRTNATSQLVDFWEQVHYKKNEPIKTGFPLLDKALDGGFYPEQLAFLGAISSLGKTTFFLQVCDNISSMGIPVLFFSLEMSRKEIISKSLSRLTFTIALKEDKKTNNAKSMRGILAGHKYKDYNPTELYLINSASRQYAEGAGKNLYIYEGNGDMGAEQIIQTVKEFIKITGKKPFVFIDYLQILAPHDPKMTDKQNTDYSVKVLKQLARDEEIAIVAISSLNRENYFAKISMQAFKESGAIEYSSDLLMGLQLKDMGTKDFNVNEAKRKDPREVELHFLKNRNGIMAKPILYNFYPKFNLYKEVGEVATEEPKIKIKGKEGIELVKIN